MQCKHIVKYLVLLMLFGSCLTWAGHLTGDQSLCAPSMLIPKCKFI